MKPSFRNEGDVQTILEFVEYFNHLILPEMLNVVQGRRLLGVAIKVDRLRLLKYH